MARSQRLERDANGVRFLGVLDGEIRHHGPSTRPDLHEPLRLELPERVAHGHDADPDPLGDLGQAKRRAGRQLAVQDRRLEALGDDFGHGPAVLGRTEDGIEDVIAAMSHHPLALPLRLPGTGCKTLDA
jgi:hypothetical protein